MTSRYKNFLCWMRARAKDLHDVFLTPILETGKLIQLEEGIFEIMYIDYTKVPSGIKKHPHLRVEAICRPFFSYKDQGLIEMRTGEILLVSVANKALTPITILSLKLVKESPSKFHLTIDEFE